jgi:hypothetical protein
MKWFALTAVALLSGLVAASPVVVAEPALPTWGELKGYGQPTVINPE